MVKYNNMVTPYLKNINSQGGTLYVFPSVSQDLTRTTVSSDYEFKFSHFACLNIPDIFSGTAHDEAGSDPISIADDNLEKGMYLEGAFPGSYPAPGKTLKWDAEGMGRMIAEHLQNYVMNFETAILNGEGDNDDYDNDILTTVSEKVFWNWMQKIGAIKFTDDNKMESYSSFKERTVQYLGNIDAINTVEINGDSFEELYLHIPSSVGASTYVYFREGKYTDNKNYLNKRYVIGSKNGKENIIGRSGSDSDPDENPFDINMSINAIFDDDVNGNVYIGDVGHTIDFRDSSYKGGDGIMAMNEESTDNFEFNAILIYYDFLKKTDDPNIKEMSTNLYGILFLDNVTDLKVETNGTNNTTKVDKQGYIQRYPKIKETILGNGNSFAMKVDIKIDTVPDSTQTVVKYDDPNDVVSMSMFQSAIVQMQNCIDMFYTQEQDIVDIKKRMNDLESLLSGVETINALSGRVDRLNDLYVDYYSVDNSTVLGLIEVLSNKLNAIMAGKKNIQLQYDTDVLQAGTGVTLDKSLNKVVINSDQKYSINTVYQDKSLENELNTFDFTAESNTIDCYIPLLDGENFAVIYLNTYEESDNGTDDGDGKVNVTDVAALINGLLGQNPVDTAIGDLIGDGKVNVTDLVALINGILGQNPVDTAIGDLNGDGKVNVTDVTALINIILSNN